MITIIQCETVEEALAFFNQKKGEWMSAIQFNQLLKERGYKPITTNGAKKNFCDRFGFQYQKKGKEWRFLVDELPEKPPNKKANKIPNKTNTEILRKISESCDFGSLDKISLPLEELDTAIFVPNFSKTVPTKTDK